MDVSVVVVSWNTRELLRQCLQSIYTNTGELRVEVLVVDNASTDGSPELVASEFPAAVLLRNERNWGFAHANNQAIARSQGRHVLLLNSDAVLLSGALQVMTTFLDQRADVGVVGAMLLNPDRSFQWSYADFPSFRGELLLATGLSRLVCPTTYPSYPPTQSRETRAVDWVSGACLMARRAAIDAIGLLDEDYFMYTEETDWCYRMRAAGWQVYFLPRAEVVHWSGRSAANVPERKRSQLYRSKWLFLRKHRSRLVAWSFARAIRAASLAKLVGWTLRSLSTDQAARERARQHVRSYRVLLSEF